VTDHDALPVLTDAQRQQIREFFKQHPDGGYKAACKAAGLLRLTKADAKTLIESDDELAECRERELGVAADSALRRIALIAQDLEHKDAFRANTFIAGALHGISEQARIQLAGDPDHPIGVTSPDVEQAVERFTATVAAAAVRAATSAAAADTTGDAH
jgi:hypothetical protein